MPTYEYACRSCGQHLEVVQSFRDDPLTDCPSCDGQLRKVFSAAGLIFKGSGWHVTDYARKGSSRPSEKTSTTSTSDSASSSSSSSSGDSSSSPSSSSGDSSSGSSSSGAAAEKSA